MESIKESHPPAMADVSRQTVADGLEQPGGGSPVRRFGWSFEHGRGAPAGIDVVGAAMREPVLVASRLITRACTAPTH